MFIKETKTPAGASIEQTNSEAPSSLYNKVNEYKDPS